MKLAFTTLGCPDWTLPQVAEKAREYGYEGVELRVADDGLHLAPSASDEDLRRTAGLFADAGVPVFSLAGYASFAKPDPAAVQANQDLLRRLMDIAEALGASCIRTYAGRLDAGADLDAAAERIAAALCPVAREAAGRGIMIALETHDSWCAGRDIMRIVDRVDSPGLGVLYDVHNTLSATGEWRQTYDLVRPRLCYWHLKDGYKDPAGRNQLVMLGAGDLPLHDLLGRLKQDGFDGFLSFEWEKRWAPDIEAPERAFPQFAYKTRTVWEGA